MWPSTVTWRSSIASSSAAWVFGDARLISSASDDVGEDRAGPELEALGGPVPHADADDVGRQQVGRELDAAVVGVDRRGERLGQRGLADAGHVLDEQVALGEQAEEGQQDDVVLALDDPADVVGDGADDRGGAVAGRDRLLPAPWSAPS